MILYGFCKLVLRVLQALASIFGNLIPPFPPVVTNILDSISTMISGGITFISYFFYMPLVVALLSLVVAFYGFKIIKDAIMKVLGHFIGN